MARRAVNRVWRAADTSNLVVPASSLLLGDAGKNRSVIEARLANQFIAMNQSALLAYGVRATAGNSFEGAVQLSFSTSSVVGALPLKSPTTGEVDFGLLIHPRFGWAGVGRLLSQTGASVLPTIPKLPMLPRSELGVPPWVISAVVLARLLRFLAVSRRRFVPTSAVEDRPRGSVEWSAYIARHIAFGRDYEVPCRFSTLQEDPDLIGAIHATALKHLSALTAVKTDALVARKLLTAFHALLERVRWAPPRWISGRTGLMLSQNFGAGELRDAIEAIQWTQEDRGLAGLSPLGGLPWKLPMDEVFESWVEGVAKKLAQVGGGIVRTGRLRQTLRPLEWSPPYSGSQRYLLPDVELVRDDETIIFDAKYKSHWEEIDDKRWHGVDDLARESHRADLLQVLAYAGATDAQRVTCVLLYPCREETWASLLRRERFFHAAEVPAGNRTVRLLLLAIPLGERQTTIAHEVARALIN